MVGLNDRLPMLKKGIWSWALLWAATLTLAHFATMYGAVYLANVDLHDQYYGTFPFLSAFFNSLTILVKLSGLIFLGLALLAFITKKWTPLIGSLIGLLLFPFLSFLSLFAIILSVLPLVILGIVLIRKPKPLPSDAQEPGRNLLL
ncbi:MAG: hypothetical protein HQK55_05315 [Deltaproteobacteria bacterium]|nr:hypothetical protein [Deltaproteobacteria bacterium]